MDNSEKDKLAIFKGITLEKKQVEAILNRSISNNEYRAYLNKPIKKHKKTPNQKLRKKMARDIKKQTKPEFQINNELRSNRFINKFKSIANEAAEVGMRRLTKKNINLKNRSKTLAPVFKQDKYNIVKLAQKNYAKFNSHESSWKIEGNVNLFNIHQAIKELIAAMTIHIPDGAKIQISM